MVARHAVAVVTLLSFSPALAENLDAEAARRFIVGNCSHSLVPMDRVELPVSTMTARHDYPIPRLGTARPVWLPAETLKLTGETVCASLNRTELCFALAKPVIKVFGPRLRGCSPMRLYRARAQLRYGTATRAFRAAVI
jgi:hypothetical protein